MIKKENDSIVYEKVIPAHGAEYVSFPESMRPEIGDYLRSQGISRLYSHQAEMFVRAGEGESLVITTATASGKTLSLRSCSGSVCRREEPSSESQMSCNIAQVT